MKTDRLSQSASVDEGFQALVSSCLNQIQSNRNGVRRHAGAAVHGMRIGLRRLKTLLALFRGFITPAELRMRKEVGWLLETLGPARDIEVFIDDLTKLPTGNRPEVIHALALMRDDLLKNLEKHFREAEQAVQSRRYALFVRRLSGLQLSPKRDWAGERLRPFAKHRLKKHHARILHQLARLGHLDTKKQHKLRIAVKELRYSLEFFSPLFERSVREKFIRSLRKLQESLGQLNDMKIHREILDDVLMRTRPDHRVMKAFAIGFIEGEHEISSRHYMKMAARIGRKLSGLHTPW